jgi:arylsulfatase A
MKMKLIIIFIFFLLISLFVINIERKSPPNFILIYIDDLGYGDLGLYQDDRLNTPAINKLTEEGQTWTNFYASASVCSPSRGALLTGNLPVRSGMYGDRLAVLWPGSLTGMPAEQVTIAEQLKKYNYETAMFGKWHLGDAKDYLPTRHGFDEWYGIPYSNDMDWTIGDITSTNINSDLSTSAEKWQTVGGIYQERLRNPNLLDWNVPIIRSRKNSDGTFEDKIEERPADQRFYTKRFTEESLSFIEKSIFKRKPFFIFLSHSMVHVPLFRSPEFENRSDVGLYGDVLEEIDWSVGQILNILEEKGIDDNTYIVFTSDNGPWLTYAPEHAGNAGPLRGGKGQTYEGGMRVMTFFTGPKIIPGIVDELGTDTDIFNTFLNLAGFNSSTSAHDSFDLSDVLISHSSSPRDFVPYFRNSVLRAFRYKNNKLHYVTDEFFLGPRTEHNPPILVNLENDIDEKFDIANDDVEVYEEIQQKVREFRESLTIAPSIFDKQKNKKQ